MINHKQPVNELPARGMRRPSGFSLIELMVAMAIFLVVGGAAVSLVRRHEVLFTSSQNQAGVNIALRNSIAQIQTDVVNAGSGYYPGANMPFWPVGITVVPATTACDFTTGYVPTCFDSFQVLTADPSMPAAVPSSDAPGQLPFNVPPGSPSGNTNLYLTFPFPTSPAPTQAQVTTQLNAWALEFAPNNEVLLISSAGQGTDTGPQMWPLTIQAQTGGVGATVTANNTLLLVVKSVVPDKLNIEDQSMIGTPNFAKTQFGGPGQDFVVRLDSVQYAVNAANQLTRQVGTAPADVIANGIVGFTLQEAVQGAPPAKPYTKLPAGSLWTTIKALQVQLTVRTPFKNDPGIGFKNNFDQGPYPVQGMSVVVSPRNLSMND